MAIQSFADKETEIFFEMGRVKKQVRWRNLSKIIRRKLDMVHYAAKVGDLRSPPNNRLEALKGKYKGFWSIRVNDQWRVVFQWTDWGAEKVQVVDYH